MNKTEETKNESTLKEILSFILLTILIVVPIRIFVAQPFIVDGESMSPTLHTGQYLIVDQLTYRFNEPERGDVVVFKLPEEYNKYLIKRLIALPGETVKIESEEVYVKKDENSDFILLEEDYIQFPKETLLNQTLGKNEYFLLGDNRANSLDSRFFGSVERDRIVGRAIFRLYPLDWMPGKVDFNSINNN